MTYDEELAHSRDVHAWAMSADVTRLAAQLEAGRGRPAIFVGSGGTLAVCDLLATLHRRFTRQMATTSSPMLLADAAPDAMDASLWLVSASGRNTDILSALDVAESRPAGRTVVLTMSPGSRLAQRARGPVVGWRAAHRDGYLATASVIALAELSIRGWASLEGWDRPVPLDWGGLCGGVEPSPRLLAESPAFTDAIESLIVLHGAWTRPAALDLEARATEAGLLPVMLTDYRGLAHGRYQWLHAHGERAGVVAFVGPAEEALAERTLSLLPPQVQRCRITLSGPDPVVALRGLVASAHLVGGLAGAAGIDPANPRVPGWGRALFKLAL